MAPESIAFPIGVEEEFQIVDRDSRELRPRAGRIVPEARSRSGGDDDDVTNELYLSQVEIGTPVCATLAGVRAELVRLRKAVIEAAGRDGDRSAIAAAGTHPFSHWDAQAMTPKPRYADLSADYRQVAREQVIFGCHVHVGIPEREEAVGVMNRAATWLPALLALSGNSPFWLGVDTGFSSYRTELWGRFPTSGLPRPFADRAEFDALVADLVAVGLIDDGSKIYWDIRPSSHVETIEFRIADVCMTIDETVMLAGLCRSLARTCHAALVRGGPFEPVRPELLVAAKFRAARDGLSGDLIDLDARRAVPAATLIGSFLEALRPDLEAEGEWDEVKALVDQTVARGNGADRQRAAFARSGEVRDVVDLVIAETGRGLA